MCSRCRTEKVGDLLKEAKTEKYMTNRNGCGGVRVEKLGQSEDSNLELIFREATSHNKRVPERNEDMQSWKGYQSDGHQCKILKSVVS